MGSLVLAGLLFSGANAADYMSTRQALQAGGVERGVGSAGMRVGAAAAETAIFELIHKQNKALGWVFVGVVVVGNGVIAAHNHRVAGSLR